MITTEELYQLYLAQPTISIDSRKVSDGCIFFALSGEHFDGNDYALEALQKGASYAIVDRSDLPEDPRLLQVDDALLALQELSAIHRATLSKPVIAITGTNGKTTTKELTAQVLATSFNVLYTEGNLNNHIGVPLTLLRLREEHDFAIIEMGASKPGDIEELCAIAQPNYGLITNIGEAHLEGFQTIIGVERTKGELYNWLREHDGKVVRREEDERLSRLGQGIPSVTYGQSQDAVIQGKLLDQSNSIFLQFEWSAPAINIMPQLQVTQLVGNYNIDNALAAISFGLFFGIEPEKIKQALSDYSPNNSRSQLIETQKDNLLIADAYNANPSSMLTAIQNFKAINSTLPKLLILGDMNELGNASQNAHLELFNEVIQPLLYNGYQAMFCGPIWSELLRNHTDERISTYESYLTLQEQLHTNPIHQHLILLKGSNGIKLSHIINDL